MQIKQYINEID
jgi:hypothetical protein